MVNRRSKGDCRSLPVAGSFLFLRSARRWNDPKSLTSGEGAVGEKETPAIKSTEEVSVAIARALRRNQGHRTLEPLGESTRKESSESEAENDPDHTEQKTTEYVDKGECEQFLLDKPQGLVSKSRERCIRS